jgi:branched-chain amino acid transport system substrate-binding protein
MKKTRQWGGALLALAGMVVLAGCGGGASNSSSSGTTTVKVGLSAGFSGAEAFLGQDAQKGAQMAIEELKQSDPRFQYSLVTADDECTPAGGASAFGHLIDVDQVDVVLGSACSGATLGGMPLLQRSKVPGMTFGATNPQISDQSGVGGNKYMWRMNLNDAIIGDSFSKFIASQGVKKAAILSQNNDFGRGAADVYKADLPKDNVTVAGVDYFPVGASDVRTQLTKVGQEKADAVLLFGEAQDCGLVVRQMNELGMHLKIFSRSACTNDEGLKAMGNPQLGNGVVEGSYWVDTPDQPMVKKYQQKYGQIPPYNAALAYYAMYTIDKALQAGGPGRDGIEKGLAKVDWKSAIGPIKFDDHDQAHPNLFLVTIDNGQIKVLKTTPTQ